MLNKFFEKLERLWLKYGWCKHQYEEVLRKYEAPKHGKIKTDDNDLIERMFHGFTIIELKCSKCGELKHHSVIGKCL